MTRALCLALSFLCVPLCLGQNEEVLVEPSLVAAKSQVEPGGELLIGVRFKIAPEWHLYWLNPGDSGVPPELELSLPAGLEAVGDWLWPAPHRIELPGDMLNYVHEGELTLLRRVRAAKTLTPGAELTLSAQLGWLVCKDICVAGEGQVSLTIEVGADLRPGLGSAAIDATLARLPQTPAGAGVELVARWEGAHLVMTVPGASQLTFFPLTPELPVPREMIARGQVEGSRIEIVYPEPQARVSGVLIAQLGDATHVLVVEVPTAD